MAKKNKKLKQIGCFILDKSGSMSTIRTQAIAGFNEYIDTLKKQKVNVDFSLVLFDTQSVERPYKNTPLKDVKPLSEETYKPMAGTPLYDACVETIEALNQEVEEMHNHGDKQIAVSVVIMTDGEENSSVKHDEKCLRDLVDKLSKKGNWTFAYMGANQDAWSNAAKIGISAGNTMDWASTGKGTAMAFRSLGNSSAQYAAQMSVNANNGGVLNSTNFFNNGGDN